LTLTFNDGHTSRSSTTAPSEHKQAKFPPALITHISLHKLLAHGFGTEILSIKSLNVQTVHAKHKIETVLRIKFLQDMMLCHAGWKLTVLTMGNLIPVFQDSVIINFKA
jgi:hypothetical protein